MSIHRVRQGKQVGIGVAKLIGLLGLFEPNVVNGVAGVVGFCWVSNRADAVWPDKSRLCKIRVRDKSVLPDAQAVSSESVAMPWHGGRASVPLVAFAFRFYKLGRGSGVFLAKSARLVAACPSRAFCSAVV
ncbi:MAG: hypothetical protein R2857_05720 [Vampirovibrionales bacterium]